MTCIDNTPTGFNPNDHLMKMPQGGKLYLPVAYRVMWFRSECPAWSIETDMIEHDPGWGRCIYKATIKNEAGRIMAQATKSETRAGFSDYIEKAETGSIGRALALCGFGTQFTEDFDEGADRIVDAPQVVRVSTAKNGRSNGSNGTSDFHAAAKRTPTADVPETAFCADCSRPLSPGQATLSSHKFGMLLCTDHQRSRCPVKVGAA